VTQRTCSHPDCIRPSRTRGYCTMHYARWLKHGDALVTLKISDLTSFLNNVVLKYDGNECFIWPYGKCKGYGQITIDGNKRYVHRIACEHVNGPPPTPKHQAAHSCGNGHLACVTKSHLSWKTLSENHADKLLHGTDCRGEKHHLAKLNAEQVLTIRASRHLPSAKVAQVFGVSRHTIKDIQSGRRWGWLKDAAIDADEKGMMG